MELRSRELLSPSEKFWVGVSRVVEDLYSVERIQLEAWACMRPPTNQEFLNCSSPLGVHGFVIKVSLLAQ